MCSSDLSNDYRAVFDSEIIVSEKSGNIFVGTLGNGSKAEKYVDKGVVKKLTQTKEGFVISIKKGKLIVLGSDKRGTAYGVLELSRMIGVSPWKW